MQLTVCRTAIHQVKLNSGRQSRRQPREGAFVDGAKRVCAHCRQVINGKPVRPADYVGCKPGDQTYGLSSFVAEAA